MLKTSNQLQVAKVKQASYAWIVIKFLAFWSASLVVLFVVALLVDINWARPQVQQIMASSLHRKVSLGRLSWNLGFNGLSIATDHIAVCEADGEPFLTAKQSEIGIGFWPLLSGRLVVHYMDLNEPVLWAIKLGDKRWNFSDLLQEQVDIRFFQIDSGHLHVLDLSSHASKKVIAAKLKPWPAYDLENVKLKMVWPRKSHRWPVFLSFVLAHPGFQTEIKLSGMGHGLLSDWQNNKLRFDLSAENLDAEDLAPFTILPLGSRGIFNLSAKGEGTLSKTLHARITYSGKNIYLPSDFASPLIAASSSGQGDFSLNKANIEWQNLSINSGKFSLAAKGTLYNWQRNEQKQKAEVKSAYQPFWDMLASLGIKNAKPKAKPPGLILESTFSAQMPGNGAFLNQAKMPWLSYFAPQRTPVLKGELELFPNHKFLFPRLTLAVGDSSLKGDGNFDGQNASFNFSGKQLAAGDLWQQVSTFFGSGSFPEARKIQLAGKIDLSGRVAAENGKTSSVLLSQLHDTSLRWHAADGRELLLTKLSGSIGLAGSRINLDRVEGSTGEGTFALSGETDGRNCRFSLDGKHLDLANLNQALKLFHIAMPPLTDGHLRGTASSLLLEASGAPEHPQVKLACQPEEIYYQAPGVARPVKVQSGSIHYEGDNLSLKDVFLVGRSEKIAASFAIKHLSLDPSLEYVKCKTQAADLAELNYYFSSALLPAKMQKQYTDFLAEWHISQPQGKVAGEIAWRADGKDSKWRGGLEFANASLLLSQKDFLLEHLNGALSLDGADVTVQNLSGNLESSAFTLSAQVKNWQQENYTVRANMHLDLMPAECQKYVSTLTAYDPSKVTFVSTRPLSLNARAQGTKTMTTVNFQLEAGRGDSFFLKTPGFEFCQPPNQTISASGNLQVNFARNLALALREGRLFLGDEELDGQGTLSFQDGLATPDLTFSLDTPRPLPTQILAYCLGLDKAKAYQGKTAFSLQFAGPANTPLAGGNATFFQAALPALNVVNAKGKITFSGWPLICLSAPSTAKAVAKLEFKSLDVGSVALENLSCLVERSPESLFNLGELEADFGHGHISGSGWLNLNSHLMHASCRMRQIDADTLCRQIFFFAGELSGKCDLDFNVDADTQTRATFADTLSGSGQFLIRQGKIARFGRLQERLTQSNLMHEGIFGFNLNNLLQSVVPVRTGDFNELSGRLLATNGAIQLNDLHYSGDDMRLWAAGKISLPLNTVTMEIDGSIPRVSSSLITGPIGEVSKGITIQKMVDVVTMHKLESLPDFPVLGKIASESQRAFSFHLTAPLSEPNLAAKSIEKSFRWLPTKPNASAHPIPAL